MRIPPLPLPAPPPLAELTVLRQAPEALSGLDLSYPNNGVAFCQNRPLSPKALISSHGRPETTVW